MSDGWLHVSGDMGPENTRITGQYLLDTADTYDLEQHAKFVKEINAATAALTEQIAAVARHFKRAPPEGPDGAP